MEKKIVRLRKIGNNEPVARCNQEESENIGQSHGTTPKKNGNNGSAHVCNGANAENPTKSQNANEPLSTTEKNPKTPKTNRGKATAENASRRRLSASGSAGIQACRSAPREALP